MVAGRHLCLLKRADQRASAVSWLRLSCALPVLRMQAWLLAGWKQEATLALSALVCRLLGALGAASDTLFRYVPELYLEATLDMVCAARCRAEPCCAVPCCAAPC